MMVLKVSNFFRHSDKNPNCVPLAKIFNRSPKPAISASENSISTEIFLDRNLDRILFYESWD